MSATRGANLNAHVGFWVRVEVDDGTTTFAAVGWLRQAGGEWTVTDLVGGVFGLAGHNIVDVVRLDPPAPRPGFPAARAPSPEDRAISPEQLLAATAAQHAASEAQRLALLEATTRVQTRLETADANAAAQRQAILEQSSAAEAAAAARERRAGEERLAAHQAAEARDRRAAEVQTRATEERLQLRMIVEQHSQQQLQLIQEQHLQLQQQQRHEADRQASVFNEIVDQLRALSNRVDRLSPSGSASPLPRRDPDLNAPPPFPSMGNNTTSVPASEASVLALIARDEEAARHKLPIWSSHDISAKAGADIFSPAQRSALSRVPELCILRAEGDFDELKLTIRALADAVIELETLGSPAVIETHFRTLLRRGTGREEAALSPERFVALQSSLTLLTTSSRPRALIDLALFALRLAPAYAKATARLERILVASISVRPGSVKQVQRWTARQLPTGTTPSEAELSLLSPTPLPVRSGGPALF